MHSTEFPALLVFQSSQKYNQESIMECLKHADSALYDIKKGTKHDFKVWQKVQK